MTLLTSVKLKELREHESECLIQSSEPCPVIEHIIDMFDTIEKSLVVVEAAKGLFGAKVDPLDHGFSFQSTGQALADLRKALAPFTEDVK